MIIRLIKVVRVVMIIRLIKVVRVVKIIRLIGVQSSSEAANPCLS